MTTISRSKEHLAGPMFKQHMVSTSYGHGDTVTLFIRGNIAKEDGSVSIDNVEHVHLLCDRCEGCRYDPEDKLAPCIRCGGTGRLEAIIGSLILRIKPGMRVPVVEASDTDKERIRRLG